MNEQFLKLLIIGDSGVGKSCMLTRFCEDKFIDAFYNTIGVDFKTKTISIGKLKCKLQIWDTAGQERFRTITSSYYKGAHGILIVFDLTNRESLTNVLFWLEEIEKNGNKQACTILIGNKNDLHAKRQVTEEEGSAFARKNRLDYIESSAFNSLNIHLVFETIAKKVLRARDTPEVGSSSEGKGTDNRSKVKQSASKSQEKSGCC